MALKARLTVAQKQTLVLTPALKVSIQLLQLSGQDLEAFIADRAEENPVLDRVGGPANGTYAAKAAGGIVALESRLAEAPSLTSRLLQQLDLAFSDPLERRVALTLLEELDESGYLTCDLGRLAEDLGVRPDALDAVLRRMQAFEPAGLFARSLAECLALQLASQDRLDETFRGLLAKLPLLTEAGPSALAEAAGISAEALTARLAILRRLDPKPGLALRDDPLVPLVPDLLVTQDALGRLQIDVNPETVPRIRLDRGSHAVLLPQLRSPEDRAYVADQVREVAWLRRALVRRVRTLRAVGRAILMHQGDYFAKGSAALRPLTRRVLAEELGLSEATVSRVVANKFLASPRGTVPLKSFFSAALGPDGEISAAAAQARLRELVAQEEPRRPLSDAKLAAKLADSGLPVARRTVAKYRDLLRIPAAAERRRTESQLCL